MSPLVLWAALAPSLVHTLQPPARAVVLVVAPRQVDVEPSPSVWLNQAMSHAESRTALQIRSQEQLGLSDLALAECPPAQLFSCWTDQAVRAAGRQDSLNWVWVLSFARRAGDVEVRSIWLPVGSDAEAASGSGSADRAQAREKALFEQALLSDWVSIRRDSEQTMPALIAPVMTWLEARGQNVPSSSLELTQVPASASVELDDRAYPGPSEPGWVRFEQMQAGSHQVTVRSGQDRWSRSVDVEPGARVELQVDLGKPARWSNHPAFWTAVGAGVGAAAFAGWAAAEAESQTLACIVPADSAADCEGGFGSTGGTDVIRLGEAAREDPGFSPAPVAIGLGVTAAASAVGAFAFPKFCRERFWACALGASVLGASAGAVSAALE